MVQRFVRGRLRGCERLAGWSDKIQDWVKAGEGLVHQRNAGYRSRYRGSIRDRSSGVNGGINLHFFQKERFLHIG